jgi:hypothetical protein
MSATDTFSTTPALALPRMSVPIGSARPLTDWVVGRTLAAPGMGTAVFADGAVWAVDRKDGGFTGDVPNGDIYRIDPASGKTTRPSSTGRLRRLGWAICTSPRATSPTISVSA